MKRSLRPNILLITSDQHRADCLETAGHPLVQTPSLSRLSREGVTFSHAFTSTPSCCPARQSLMCGQWAETHGGLWNYDLGLPLRDFCQPTWSQALSASGYRMTHVGKWHVHETRTPLEFGYDRYVPLSDYARWRNERGMPSTLPSLDPVVAETVHPTAHKFFGGLDPVALEDSRTHWLAAKAIEVLEEYAEGEQPWHLRLNFKSPHLPCYPTEPFYSQYAPEDVTPWGSWGDRFEGKPYIQRQQLASWRIEDMPWEAMSHFVARYLASVSQVDDAVGRVLNALDALGLAESTIVIYGADHGGMAGSHGMFDKHMVMYDDVLRVPLIMRGPGIARGVTQDAFVSSTVGLANTLCDLTGIERPETFQGESFAALLEGGAPPDDWPDAIVSTYNGNQFGLFVQRMIRTKAMKYVWNPTAVDELYDLRADPWEMTNLIADASYGDVLAELRRQLLEELTERGDDTVKTTWMQDQLAHGCKVV